MTFPPAGQSESDAAEPAQHGGWRHLLARFEVNRAVIYAILLRVWQLAAGALSILLFTRFFTKDVQGYHYTFSSLLLLQAAFEIGCTTVVTNLASREWAKLKLDASGRITGDAEAQSRLAGLAWFMLRLYGVLFLAFCLCVGIGGGLFLDMNPAEGVSWQKPWFALVVVNGLLFWLLPLNALLEGCNQVTAVNRFRLVQAVTANITTWVCVIAWGNLWVAVAATAARLGCELFLLAFRYRRFFTSLIFTDRTLQMSWRDDIWPLQWRLGLQTAFGAISNTLFVVVMYRYQSPAVAGQMGPTWSMLIAVQSGALAWIQTRVPRFGILVARREYAKLDRLFRRLTTISLAVIALGCAGLWVVVLLFNHLDLAIARRILPPRETAVFAAAIILLQWSHCLAAYLRAHQRDPLLVANLLFYLASGAGVWYFGSEYGPLGAGLAYLGAIAFINLPLQTAIWRTCRRDWHRETANS